MSSSSNYTRGKRNLPSWMSSKEEESTGPNNKNDRNHDDDVHENEKPNQGKGNGKFQNTSSSSRAPTKSSKSSISSSSSGSNFSKLLDGVVFVLSGFVNPERGTLRSQALEMGGEYQPDWGPHCTLLICAYSNTPKFRQVEKDCGTIVSKEWISECYSHKKLVDIERYLMHAGKPWRKSGISLEVSHDQQSSLHRNSQQQVEKESDAKISQSAPSKNRASKSHNTNEQFSPSMVKHWVVDDLDETISWLQSQEEKPDPGEINDIAAEGILTCIQDAIDTLEQQEDVRQVTEQWGFIPRLVEELAKLDKLNEGSSNSSPKKELHKQAIACKRVYETELKNLHHDSAGKSKKGKTSENERVNKGKAKHDYDSDDTIEMTEEEIDLAYRTLSSKC